MALDKTDQRLVNGLIIAVVIFGVLYFWPEGWIFDGYSALLSKESTARTGLENQQPNYSTHYFPMQPINFGQKGDPIVAQGDVASIADMRKLYDNANTYTTSQIEVKEQANKILFPDWTNIPPEESDAGTYFRKVWERHKNIVEIACRNADIKLDDRDIGFQRISGNIPNKDKAWEYLRELYIAEKIIDLCVQAKLVEQERERKLGKQPEAFMRIMLVEPRDSETTGPTTLIPNPNYNPTEKNPASSRFKRYNIEVLPSFIQEYPVKIQLICDTNTFITFMHSIRTPKDLRFEFTGVTMINGNRHAELKNKETNERREINELDRVTVKNADGQPDTVLTVNKIEPLSIHFKDEAGKEYVVQEGQFLVIRQLQILAPSMDHSRNDKSEQREFKSEVQDEKAVRRWPEKTEHILVTIIAAGMDFYDPLKMPDGIHPKSKSQNPAGGVNKNRRKMGAAGPTVQKAPQP